MKNTVKYFLLFVISVLPVSLSFFLYSLGVRLSIMLFILYILLIFLYNRIFKKRIHMSLYCAFTILSYIAADLTITHLYYNRISSDSETLLVGNAGTQFFAIILTLLSISYIIAKKEK